MKISQIIKLVRIAVKMSLPMICFAGCASIEIPDIQIQPVSQYKLFQEKDGLRIAIDPFFEKNRLKEFFGTDLLSEGILPVLVVVENHNNKSNFLFEKDSFLAEGEEFIEVPESAKLKEKLSEIEVKMKKLQPIVTMPIVRRPSFEIESLTAELSIALWGSVLLYQNLTTITQSEAINHNIKKKALMEKTLYPATSQSGFVYFRLQNKPNISTIFVKAKNIQNEEVLMFRFIISEGE